MNPPTGCVLSAQESRYINNKFLHKIVHCVSWYVVNPQDGTIRAFRPMPGPERVTESSGCKKNKLVRGKKKRTLGKRKCRHVTHFIYSRNKAITENPIGGKNGHCGKWRLSCRSWELDVHFLKKLCTAGPEIYKSVLSNSKSKYVPYHFISTIQFLQFKLSVELISFEHFSRLICFTGNMWVLEELCF